MMARKAWTVAAALVVGAWGAPAGLASADPPAPPPAPKTIIDHGGMYAVGTDILPGTYSSAGPVGNGACYWKRLSSLNGKDIIDSAMSTRPQVVRIDPTDAAFKTDGCQPWQKTDSDAAPAAELPPLAGLGQLHSDVDTLNGNARQFGGGQVPPP